MIFINIICIIINELNHICRLLKVSMNSEELLLLRSRVKLEGMLRIYITCLASSISMLDERLSFLA